MQLFQSLISGQREPRLLPRRISKYPEATALAFEAVKNISQMKATHTAKFLSEVIL